MKIDTNDRYGNGFLIIGIVRRHLKETGQDDRLTDVTKRMSSGDFDHLLDVAEEVTGGAISFSLYRSEGAIKQVNFTNIDGEAVSRCLGDWIQFYPNGRVDDEQVGEIISIRPKLRPGRHILVMENTAGFAGTLEGHLTIETPAWLCR